MGIKHTPGPWDFRKGDTLNPDRPFGIVRLLSRDECLQIDGDDSGFGDRSEVIAEVTDGTEAVADARLIAAAPALLAACYQALGAMRDLAEQAGDVPEWNTGGDAYEACNALCAAIAKATGEDNE